MLKDNPFFKKAYIVTVAATGHGEKSKRPPSPIHLFFLSWRPENPRTHR